MPNTWMIRAGEGGYLVDEFARGYVAIGWRSVGDLSQTKAVDEIRAKYLEAYRDGKRGAAANAVAMLYKFRHKIKVGDWALTYDPTKREYLLGKVASDYLFDSKLVEDFPQVRKVTWEHRISRDALKPASKNSLGSTLTLFCVEGEVLADLLDAAGRPQSIRPPEDEEGEKEDWKQIRDETIAKAHERIKDKLVRLSDEELPRLMAAILRAMGFKTRISAKGPDRGVDVLASPDGLGFTEPRIKAEIKHRPGTPMGAPEIRSFLGALRSGDRGLYVSTGGFSKEAKYEAERSIFPLSLVDLDELARLVVEYYAHFDTEGQTLLPLVRIYWPEP